MARTPAGGALTWPTGPSIAMYGFCLVVPGHTDPFVLGQTAGVWPLHQARLSPIKSFQEDHVAFSSSGAGFMILEGSPFHSGPVVIV